MKLPSFIDVESTLRFLPLIIIAAMLTGILTISCSFKNTSTTTTANTITSAAITTTLSTSTTNSAMTAQVDGVTWSATVNPIFGYNHSLLTIVGYDSKGSSITLSVAPTGPGTYSLTFGNTTGSSAIYANSEKQEWATYLTGGTGSVTITTLTPNHATGTFFFDGESEPSEKSSTVHVTNGEFDVGF